MHLSNQKSHFNQSSHLSQSLFSQSQLSLFNLSSNSSFPQQSKFDEISFLNQPQNSQKNIFQQQENAQQVKPLIKNDKFHLNIEEKAQSDISNFELNQKSKHQSFSHILNQQKQNPQSSSVIESDQREQVKFSNSNIKFKKLQNSLANLDISEIKIGKQKDQEKSFSVILPQDIESYSNALYEINVDSISYEAKEKLKDRIEKFMFMLESFHPEELKFLQDTLQSDQVQILRKFKVVYGSCHPFPPPQRKKFKQHRMVTRANIWPNKYEYYNQWEMNVKDKQSINYFVLDLSYMEFDMSQLIKCKWQNLIYMDFEASKIDNDAWHQLVSIVHRLYELRKLNLRFNRISQVSEKDLIEFCQLKHFNHLNLIKNPIRQFSLYSKFIYNGEQKFVIEASFMDIRHGSFNMNSFLKLGKQYKNRFEQVDFTNKGFGMRQLRVFIDYLRMFPSLKFINFDCNLVKGLEMNDLKKLNDFVLVHQARNNRKFYLSLEKNPLTIKDINLIKEFYSQNEWSLLCIIMEENNKEQHNKRLIFQPIRHYIMSTYLSDIKTNGSIQQTTKDLSKKIKKFILDQNLGQELMAKFKDDKQIIKKLIESVEDQLKKIVSLCQKPHQKKKIQKSLDFAIEICEQLSKQLTQILLLKQLL